MTVEASAADRRDIKDYKLTVIMHRHGPKKGDFGGLREQDRDAIAEYFRSSYEGVATDLPEGEGVEIDHSSIPRAKDTALIAAKNSGEPVLVIKPDARLSDDVLVKHMSIIDSWGGVGGPWISVWMNEKKRPHHDFKTYNEVLKDMITWLMEKIGRAKKQGGKIEAAGFTHLPQMMSLIIFAEKITGEKLLPEGWQKMSDASQIIGYLETISFYLDSKDPNFLFFNYRGKNVKIPMDKIEELG